MSCEKNFQLGINAKLYIGTCGAAIAALTEAPNVRDVTVNLSAAEADITTRDNDGWTSSAKTLKSAEISFTLQLLNDGTNTIAGLLRDDFLSDGDQIEIAALTGDRDTAGSEGPQFSGYVSQFNRNEANTEAITYAVTVKPSDTVAWLEITSS